MFDSVLLQVLNNTKRGKDDEGTDEDEKKPAAKKPHSEDSGLPENVLIPKTPASSCSSILQYQQTSFPGHGTNMYATTSAYSTPAYHSTPAYPTPISHVPPPPQNSHVSTPVQPAPAMYGYPTHQPSFLSPLQYGGYVQAPPSQPQTIPTNQATSVPYGYPLHQPPPTVQHGNHVQQLQYASYPTPSAHAPPSQPPTAPHGVQAAPPVLYGHPYQQAPPPPPPSTSVQYAGYAQHYQHSGQQ